MADIKASIKFIGELDFAKFDIPMYQRPYRWQPEHVKTLLNSIKDNMGKVEYRIGSIIVYTGNNTLEIVDGQQRLTTLSLLFLSLDPTTKFKLSCKYTHLDSKQNIYANYRYIQDWLELNKVNTDEFKKFILEKCSVVLIEADDYSEAFQMFDSQNGRGKELEAYNLLKAYHLRAIDNETTQITITDEKIEIDRKWEEAASQDTIARKRATSRTHASLLKFIVNELYRIRQWSRLNRGYNFGKSKVKEFKGVQFIDGKSPLPLHNHSFLLYLYFKKTAGVALRSTDNEEENPFVTINMDIINGTMFFSYIQTYVSAYHHLFEKPLSDDSPLKNFREDYKKYAVEYDGALRDGDSYIRDIYISLIIALYDRFGEKCVADYYKYLYNLAYRKRLESAAVYYDSAAEYPKEIFKIITSAINESDLKQLIEKASAEIKCKKLGPKEMDVARFIVFNTNTKITCINTIEISGKKYNEGDVIPKEDLAK